MRGWKAVCVEEMTCTLGRQLSGIRKSRIVRCWTHNITDGYERGRQTRIFSGYGSLQVLSPRVVPHAAQAK